MKHSGLALLCVLTLASCVKEDHFGRSNLNEILYFTVAQQSGVTQIRQDSLLIRVTVSASADLTALYADSIALSSYASVVPAQGEVVDFSQPVAYTVTAENGATQTYTVVVSRQSANPQLENASFDAWYTPEGKNYLEPGADASTLWATGNAGVVTLGQANVTPFDLSGSDRAAQLITRDLGPLGGLVGQRMASGSLFTGTFVLNIADPLSSPRFGIPFTERPAGFTIDYTYEPGATYKNGTGQTLAKNDSCDIYLLLENRDDPNNVKRVATGWFRSGDAVTTFTTLSVDLVYGSLPPGTPAYVLPANGSYATASERVTHLSFVCASSAYGALFEGGVDTRLVVNNFRLTY